MGLICPVSIFFFFLRHSHHQRYMPDFLSVPLAVTNTNGADASFSELYISFSCDCLQRYMPDLLSVPAAFTNINGADLSFFEPLFLSCIYHQRYV